MGHKFNPPAVQYDDEELYSILEQMTEHGGSFVVVLAQLTRLANPTNKAKLLKTFRGYYAKYYAWATKKKED